MKRSDVEVLLFRMQAAYASATVATAGTLEEWADSTIMSLDTELVFGAFAQWRDREMYPPRIPELLAEAQNYARQLAAEREARAIEEHASYVDGELVTFKCGGCLDQVFLPIAGSDPITGEPDYSQGVQPCRDCSPVQYELWKGGHYLPGHNCAECIARRHGHRRAS